MEAAEQGFEAASQKREVIKTGLSTKELKQAREQSQKIQRATHHLAQ